MISRLGRIGAVASLGASAAVLWAYGLTVLQPAAEAIGYAENNSYWPRDVRWPIVLGVTGLLVALSRGNRRGWVTALGFGGLWIVADLLLDRAAVTAWAPVAVVSALAVVAAAVTVGWPDRSPSADRRAVLAVVAMCAASAPLAAMVESPTDTEPQLPWTRLSAAALLVVAAVAGALVTAVGRTRLGPGAVTVVVAVAALGIAPGRMVTGVIAGAGLLVAVWLLSRPWPGWGQAAGVAVASLVAYPVLVAVAVYVQFAVPVGAWFTAIAGNEPIHSADSDILFVAAGMGVGLVFTLASRAVDGLRPTPVLTA